MYLVLRIIKIIAVSVYFTGTIGAFYPRSYEERQRFAYYLAGPGFGAVWLTGFALAYERELSMLSTWILLSLVLSLFSLQVVLFSVGRDGRRTVTTTTLALLPLVVCVILMVLKV